MEQEQVNTEEKQVKDVQSIMAFIRSRLLYAKAEENSEEREN